MAKRFHGDGDLLVIILSTLILILIILALPFQPLRLILGLPFILFFPGYTLIAFLFPRKEGLDAIERVALSFGLSIAVVPLIGLVLNYTPWGIRLLPILISLSTFIVVMSGLAWRRRHHISPQERFTVTLNLTIPAWITSWRGSGKLDKALTLALILAILGAMTTLGYVMVKPKVGERFTEFYILGPHGRAEDYPHTIRMGREGKVIIGVINREHAEASYHIKIRVAGELVKEVGPILLSHGEKWEQPVSFSPPTPGENQKVEFLLHKGGTDEPYLTVHLWVDVPE